MWWLAKGDAYHLGGDGTVGAAGCIHQMMIYQTSLFSYPCLFREAVMAGSQPGDDLRASHRQNWHFLPYLMFQKPMRSWFAIVDTIYIWMAATGVMVASMVNCSLPIIQLFVLVLRGVAFAICCDSWNILNRRIQQRNITIFSPVSGKYCLEIRLYVRWWGTAITSHVIYALLNIS